MTKQMLAWTAAALVGFLADSASAQQPMPSPAPVTVAPQPVTMAPRTGLFSRLRGRRAMPVVNQPVVTASPAAVGTAPTPSGVQQAQAITGSPSTVQQAQYPPIQGGVQQAQATTPAATPMATTTTPMPATVAPMQVTQPRQGLFARLRARRGM